MMKLVFSRALFILLLFPVASFGFNLAIASINETCPGNGSLQFVITNPDPNGSVVFFVYKLPDLTTPYASGPDTTLNGLSPGEYRIIAKETVGSIITTQQRDVTITSSFIPLTYTVQVVNEGCSGTSTMTVTATTGTPATYAIISGPATFSPQSSTTFTGLVAGVYRVKVFDSCGNGVVQAFTLINNTPVLTIGNPVFSNTSPPSCNFLVVTNTITPSEGSVIAYPLQIHYILHLPGGDNHINTTLPFGNPTSQDITLTVPYQNNQTYVYDVILTDACGTTYPLNNFIVNNAISLSQSLNTLPCNKYYFTLDADNYTGSYMLQFTSTPVGFNPTAYNSAFPGPYNQDGVAFGSESNLVPIGDYTATITDSCGKTDTVQFTIVETPPVPIAVETSNGCLSTEGQININIANYKLVTAIVTAAPANYPYSLPHNVSPQIDSAGALSLALVPLGDYTFRLIDDCGNIYDPVYVNAPLIENQGLEIEVRQGCGTASASVKIVSNNSKLTSVRITEAPEAFAFSLPYTISNHIISSGELFLEGLPSGSYTFTAVDECNFTSTETTAIDGYTISSSSFSLVPDCGAFNIPLNFIDNVSGTETFWLQKLLDSGTGTWGNPFTEAVYFEGTVPDVTSSYPLENNTTNLNFTVNGVFRIVHHFTSFNNGSDINAGLVPSATKNCIEILAPTLTFSNALAINDVVRIPCSTTGNFDVLLNTTGPAPLQHRIIEKDGISFIVNNGTSNLFLNMVPGIYKFEVEDNCGNSVTRTFDVSDLVSLVIIYPVCNLLFCTPSISGNETFDLSSQSDVILGDQSTADYTLSYHTSLTDANSNNNPITNLTAFNPTSNTQTIYIRLIFNQFPNCYQTASFDLITGQNPRINLLTEYVVCDSQPIQLDASIGNLPTTTYVWSDGSTTPTSTISEMGTSTVSITATNIYGNCNDASFSCSTTNDITVNIAEIPEIDYIETHDWTDNENSITVVTSNDGEFEYSLDGITFQESPDFLNLRPDLYIVYVRDTGGCRIVTEEIWLLNYPKFFTPNGDGYNETWFVKNSENEPDFKVYIYDRYGKVITSIISDGPGWDGTLNGKLLFADDYWFTAYRQDGRILKGHFTLKR